jgi:DNA repair exonuclease SbcCD ATPase subunit
LKIIANLKSFITGTRDEAKAAVDELAVIEAAYAETASEIQGLNALKLGIDMKSDTKHPAETSEQYARRMWELQTERKAIIGKIDETAARLKELSTKRADLRKTSEEIARTAILAEGSSGGATAISALAAAKQVVTDLEAKRTDAVRHSEALAAERSEIALRAHSGDDAARRRLDELHGDIGRQSSELASLEAAVAEALQRVRDAEAAVASQDKAYRQAEAARISALLLDQSAAVDKALADAAAALHRRRELASELSKTGVVSSDITKRMTGPSLTINRALAAAGLGDFARFDRGGRATALVDNDGFLGKPASPAVAA